ncbi:hypothetical protein B0F90DRAFT_1760247 [Multifurca ochricompacta]|uniref:Uncharacterized protein n=1 Tax=Multifurca ochricompacta TaxID=376703 RepID=A0AAD4LYV9_9AGAM|nr:hypothetical protein B0F90DRAFT_1760247 [Multifurca ochricompacta]
MGLFIKRTFWSRTEIFATLAFLFAIMTRLCHSWTSQPSSWPTSAILILLRPVLILYPSQFYTRLSDSHCALPLFRGGVHSYIQCQPNNFLGAEKMNPIASTEVAYEQK